MLVLLLFPLFLRAGFPPPSPCVTDRAFLIEHGRECALGAYDPVGIQSMIDGLYLSGAEWVASLVVAMACAFLGALALTILVYKLFEYRQRSRLSSTGIFKANPGSTDKDCRGEFLILVGATRCQGVFRIE
jgi:hypothetical protein